eukprot:s40_g3.t1
MRRIARTPLLTFSCWRRTYSRTIPQSAGVPSLKPGMKSCPRTGLPNYWRVQAVGAFGSYRAVLMHLLQAAQDASELKTALKLAGCEASMVEASPALRLKCCAFDSEWLDRRLRLLPEDSTPWRGLDLRALNQLHAGQRSVDLWPLLSSQLLVVSSPVRELGRFSLFQQEEEVNLLDLECQRSSHGILFWLEAEALSVDWYQVLISKDQKALSELRHLRFGLVLLPEAALVGEALSVTLRLESDGNIIVSK